jgi:hypothetical protein
MKIRLGERTEKLTEGIIRAGFQGLESIMKMNEPLLTFDRLGVRTS